jgi:hypothetical protein
LNNIPAAWSLRQHLAEDETMKFASSVWATTLGLSIAAVGCTIVAPPASQSDESASSKAGGSSVPGGSDNGSPSAPGDGSHEPATPGGGSAPLPAPGQLFSPASPWNTPATGTADAKSATMITSLEAAFVERGNGFEIAGLDAYPDYGVPFYEAGAATPRAQVKGKYEWWTGLSGVPIPSQASPAAGSDHHLSIWDVPNHTVYEFWEAAKNSDGTWSAGAGATFDTNGLGYQAKPNALSARAYGGSLIAGGIRLKEMQAGVIRHALGMAYPNATGTKYAMGLGVDGVTQNIASHCDNQANPELNTAANIPEGARLRLKASVDVDGKCGASKGCKVIGAALKKYGAYVVDHSRVATFYTEILTGTGASWSGTLGPTDARAFAAEDFEVLALPAVLTSAP